MKWFLSLTMRGKLLVCFGLIFVLFAGVIATAYTGIAMILESQNRLYEEDFANVRDLMALRANYNGMRVLMLEVQLLSKRTEQDPLLAQAAERSKQIDRIMLSLLERAKNDPNRRSRLEELKSVWQAFAQTKDAEIIPLILTGNLVASRQFAVGVQQGRAQKIRAIAEELGKASEEGGLLGVAHAKQRANQLFGIFLFVGSVAVAIGIVLARLMERVIAGPLRELSRTADLVAAGDLTVNMVRDHRADEVGILSETFSRMVESLREVTREIREGINVLGSSASEILAATIQVASGAAETGTAISQTTTTVEEVKQTAGATAQVRSILTDIQKATSAAVLATEQGTKAVDAGVKQSTGAAESIRVLGDSIAESTQATQIAASSQQQLVGMDQVASAMESIKQASTQTVVGTKQAEAAAKNLHELGQRLKQLVERYRLPGSGPALTAESLAGP